MGHDSGRIFAAVTTVLLALSLLSAVRAEPAYAQRAETVSAAQAGQATYVGSEICRACHVDAVAAWEETKMAKLFLSAARNEVESRGCEACHGPASAHVQTGDIAQIFRFSKNSPATVGEKNERCLQCHEKGARSHWSGSTHESRNIACVQCHSVMKEVSPERQLAKASVEEVCYQCHQQRKAQAQLSSHMPVREGKLTCTSCHNPHGSTGPSLLVANSPNEVCYQCHTERRGPFLWEHPPVTENCMNCHEPHGSINDNLLKIREPRLCQRCHIEQRHPTTPQSATARFVFNRSCTNCHSQMHGSNHPAGMRFHR